MWLFIFFAEHDPLKKEVRLDESTLDWTNIPHAMQKTMRIPQFWVGSSRSFVSLGLGARVDARVQSYL